MNNRKLLYISLLLAALFGVLRVAYVNMTNDTDIFIHYAYQMAHQSGFYEHTLEVNPPLYILLNIPAVLLAVSAHIQPGYVMHSICLIACVLSLLSLYHVLKRHDVTEGTRNGWLAASAIALIVTPSTFDVYGDREHLLYIFTLPWICQMLLRLRPLNYTCLLAAIGFCIKPYDTLIFATLALAGGPSQQSLQQRVFSASTLIVGSVILLYWASVFYFFPAYVHTVVPLASVAYPAAPAALTFYLNIKKVIVGIVVIALPLLSVFGYVKKAEKSLPWYGFILSAFLVYSLNAGWTYTIYLIMVPFILAGTIPFCSEYAKNPHALQRIQRPTLAVFLLLISVSAQSLGEDIYYTLQHGYGQPSAIRREVYNDLRKAAGNEYISLSVAMWGDTIEKIGAPPTAVYAYYGLWPLRWMYIHPNDKHFGFVMQTICKPLLSSLEEHPSATLIVDTSPDRALVPGKDLMTFLKQDAALRIALSQYTQTGAINDCTLTEQQSCSFTVWHRSH
jgi:hypothetical protein